MTTATQTPRLEENRERGSHSLQRLVGRHGLTATLYNADCLDVLPIEADAVVTDPPYGIAFKHSGRANLGNKSREDTIIGDDKPFDPAPWLDYPIVVMWGADHYAHRLPEGRWLVWDKLGGRDAFGDSFSDAEVAWANRKGAMRIHRRMWKGTLREGIDRAEKRHHVSQKPVELMAWCLEQLSVPIGATVLDPFMGSGSTGIACLRTGRNFIGIERDAAHYATACGRIAHELDGALL
jgi:site-specific DNA-methyltransferase (adenine-specific)